MKYAGFAPRFLAGLVDFIVFLPLIYLHTWIESHSYTGAMLAVVPYFLAYFLYNVLFLARYGQTIGKMALRIRVTRLDGSAIGFREALLRHAVDMLFGLVSAIGTLVAIHATGPSAFGAGHTWVELEKIIGTHTPPFAEVARRCGNVWVWSELIVLLLNKKKRALHDFIAGTVVVYKGFAKPSDDARSNWPYANWAPGVRPENKDGDARPATPS